MIMTNYRMIRGRLMLVGHGPAWKRGGNGREWGSGSVFVLRETRQHLLRVVLNEHYLHANVFIATVNAPWWQIRWFSASLGSLLLLWGGSINTFTSGHLPETSGFACYRPPARRWHAAGVPFELRLRRFNFIKVSRMNISIKAAVKYGAI